MAFDIYSIAFVMETIHYSFTKLINDFHCLITIKNLTIPSCDFTDRK